MKFNQKQSLEAYLRVQDFLKAHPLTAPASYAQPQQQLDDVVAQLSSHSEDQSSGSRMKKAAKSTLETLSRQLRDRHLRPIARIAKAVLRGAPGIDEATRMPADPITTTRLLAEAQAFRDVAAPYEAVLVNHGRPADFLARLDTAIKATLEASLDTGRSLAKQVGATAGIRGEIKRGRDAVEMLDAIVRSEFGDDAYVLAEWRSARRLRFLSRGSGVVKPDLSVSTNPATEPATTSTPADKTIARVAA